MSTTQPHPSGPDFWQPKILSWKQSGLSGAQFCKLHQLTYHQFVYWRQKLVRVSEPAAASPPAPSRFAEARRTADAGEAPGLSLTLPSGLTMQGINAANLPVVMQLLEAL